MSRCIPLTTGRYPDISLATRLFYGKEQLKLLLKTAFIVRDESFDCEF